MHTILLSIGSNTYAERNIARAKQQLAAHFPSMTFTQNRTSKPYGSRYKRPFVNLLAATETADAPEHICALLKSIEAGMGRLPADKEKGRVVIDIDLVRYDNIILRPKDFERSYVRDLIDEIDAQ